MMQEESTTDNDYVNDIADEKKTESERENDSTREEKAFPPPNQQLHTHSSPPPEHYRHNSDEDDDEDGTIDSFVPIDSGFQCRIIMLGQALSFLVACNAAIQSSLYLDCNLSAPSFTLGMFYLTLTASLIPLFRQQYYTAVQTTSPRNFDPQNAKMRDNHERGNGNPHVDDDVGDQNALQDSENSGEEDDDDEDVDGLFHSKSQGADCHRQPPKYRFFFGLLSLHGSPWLYFAMAILDVYANFFMVLAYKYTTITSVTLFDALAIPSAMVLSKVFLVRRYTKLHYIGVTAAMIGVIANVFQDYKEDRLEQQLLSGTNATHTTPASRFLLTAIDEEEEYPHKVSGDFLAITAGILVGANNVLGERAIRHLGGPNEYLGMVGLFAACICAIQTVLTETDEIAEFFARGDKSETCNEGVAWLLVFAFVFCSAMVYVATSRFLQVSEATFLNLSLLTGDLWSVAFSVFAQRIVPQAPFFVALLLTLSGVLVYEKAPSPIGEEHDEHQRHGHQQQYPHDGHFQLPQRRQQERQIVSQSSSSYDDDDDVENMTESSSHRHVD